MTDAELDEIRAAAAEAADAAPPLTPAQRDLLNSLAAAAARDAARART